MAEPVKYNKGTTLIELVLYMGIFIILVVGMLHSVFYLQKVLERNAVEYKTEENIYRQLNLLQKHLSIATKVEIGSSSLRIYNIHGYVEQYLQDSLLHMRYVYVQKPDKDVVVYPLLKLEKFSFVQETGHETLLGNSILWVEIERVDSRGKLKMSKEYLLGYRN